MAKVIWRRGKWYSDFRINGRRVRRPLSKDKRQATIELGKLIESSRARATGRAEKNATWGSFKDRYLEHLNSKRPNTTKRDRAAIAALEHEFPLHHLAQITPDLLDRFKSNRLVAGRGKQTISRDLSALKAMMRKAEGWGYMDGPQDWRTVKRFKVARKKLQYYTPAELARLLGVCKGIWRTLVMLGARAGLRRGEVLSLTWDDVDFERGRIHVVAKELEGERWEPKDYEQRFIPMVADLRAHLLSIRKGSPGRFVFANENGKQPNLNVMSSYMRKLARKVGLGGAIHILRHTFASHLVQAGYSMKRVKDWMGHADMKTLEIYAELAPEDYEGGAIVLPDAATGSGVGSSVGSGQNVRSGSSRVHEKP